VRGRRFLDRYGNHVQLLVDLAAWCVALYAALSVRHDFTNGWHEFSGLARVLPLVLVAQFWIGIHVGLYQRRWRFGSFEEVRSLALTAGGVGVLVTAVDYWFLDRLVPLSVPFGATVIALVAMLAPRYLWRMAMDHRLRPTVQGGAERIIVIGAGEGGAQALTALLRNPDSPMVPVALLDDDPDKRRLSILGVHVEGTTDDLEAVCRRFDATSALLAIPSASGELVRAMTERCQQAGIALLVLPQTSRLYGRSVATSDIRRPTAADLLGRREIDTDVHAIAGYLNGKRVLVTGAGGSIGSELCRQITRFGPAELVMLDRDESALHAVQLSIEGRALLESPNLVVADIRDRDRVLEVFSTWRPQVVFHAAALKHLPLLELHAQEGVKTNVYGTQHLLDAAVAHGVSHFVNISTDKAADPSSVLGATKRISERTTAEAGRRSEGNFLSVRFGNVLGSRGSLLDSLLTQIHHGGPVTITHPEVTRYFMTIEEAVQLVIQAGAIGSTGQALVLDMGEPVRILDLAHQLIALAGRPTEVVFTGLRPGEKLHEVLLGDQELDVRPAHPLISHVDVPPLAATQLGALADASGPLIKLGLVELCTADASGVTS
jgi:FlaA1/EpsC-like NDP-sugar epimerase